MLQEIYWLDLQLLASKYNPSLLQKKNFKKIFLSLVKSTTKKSTKAKIYYEIYKAYCRKYTACSVSMDRFTVLTTLDFTVSS